MTDLRPSLRPVPRDPAVVAALAVCIDKIVAALEAGEPTDALMAEHNQLCGRSDIPVSRYVHLHAAQSSEEAAAEALCPKPVHVPDLSRDELEDLARLSLTPDDLSHQTYYVALFTLNTPHGSSDLFFWPDPAWLADLGTDQPTPSHIVDKALGG